MTDAFIVAACAPPGAHASGTLDEAERLRPAVAGIHVAAILGDAERVRALLAEDPSRATERGGPYGWDALTHLCFSRYLRLRGSDDFTRAAEALLDAGADPDTGFFDSGHQPRPTFESALYGAAGVAHHEGVTRLLLERGADPNKGGEVAYHAPEGFDDGALRAVVESGRLDASGLTTALHRKLDWTDLRGAVWLLEHGADPNALSAWGHRALDHALRRDNALPLIEALLAHGADPALTDRDGHSAAAVAARAGRADALALFGDVPLHGDDAFFAALARADEARVRELIAAEPGIVERLDGARRDPGVVAILAGAGNTAAVALALDLGFALGPEALERAVWRERADTVRLLLERGARVTPQVIALAERAQTEHSEFTPHGSRAVLDALRS
jgi:ankyrin repeat protein